jgi:hypothetical protein
MYINPIIRAEGNLWKTQGDIKAMITTSPLPPNTMESPPRKKKSPDEPAAS